MLTNPTRLFSQPDLPTIFSKSIPSYFNAKPLATARNNSRLFLKKSNRLLHLPDLLFISADHVYCRISLIDGQQLLERVSLQQLQAILPPAGYLRIHRSHLINIAHVARWTTTEITVGKTTLPISRARRTEVLKNLNHIFGTRA